MDQAISLEVVLGFLVAAPLFRELDAAELGEVARIMQVQRLAAGERVFREGAPGNAWYVVFEGEAEVFKDASGRRIALLGPGSCFGEIAILDGSIRSASVRATGPLTVFRFDRPQFEELLAQGSLAAYKLVAGMAKVLSERHRQLTHQISELVDRDAGATGARELVDRFNVSE